MQNGKWNTNFYLEHSTPKNETTFSEVIFLPEIFQLGSIYITTEISEKLL